MRIIFIFVLLDMSLRAMAHPLAHVKRHDTYELGNLTVQIHDSHHQTYALEFKPNRSLTYIKNFIQRSLKVKSEHIPVLFNDNYRALQLVEHSSNRALLEQLCSELATRNDYFSLYAQSGILWPDECNIINNAEKNIKKIIFTDLEKEDQIRTCDGVLLSSLFIACFTTCIYVFA